MNVSYWISKRLRLAGDFRKPSAGIIVAITGIALAVIVMEFTLAIVLGFKNGIRNRLAGFEAQITISAPYLENGLQDASITLSPKLERIIAENLTGDYTQRQVIRQPGILKTNNDFQGVIFIAQEGHDNFKFEKSNIVEGAWPDFSSDTCRSQIVISKPMAQALNLGIGDKLYSTFIIDESVRLRRHKIAALYQSNFGEYDMTAVYASPIELRGILGLDSLESKTLEIRGLDFNDLSIDAQSLQDALIRAVATGDLNNYYPVSSVEQTGAMYFNWLALLDTNVVVIFILMLCVSGFTLISCLFILILERVKTIGILRSFGAKKSMVRRIFIYMAMRVVIIGLIIGNLIGIPLLLLQLHYHIVPLNPEMYYLDTVPVEINIWYLVALNIGVVASAWLILVLPSHLASAIDPAKTVNYD